MINIADHIYTEVGSMLEVLYKAGVIDNPRSYELYRNEACAWWMISATLSRVLPKECPVITCCGNYFVPQTHRNLSEDMFLSGAADVF